MNPRQHPNSMHLQRSVIALLPGGFWHVGQFLTDPCPAGDLGLMPGYRPAKRDRVFTARVQRLG